MMPGGRFSPLGSTGPVLLNYWWNTDVISASGSKCILLKKKKKSWLQLSHSTLICSTFTIADVWGIFYLFIFLSEPDVTLGQHSHANGLQHSQFEVWSVSVGHVCVCADKSTWAQPRRAASALAGQVLLFCVDCSNLGDTDRQGRKLSESEEMPALLWDRLWMDMLHL